MADIAGESKTRAERSESRPTLSVAGPDLHAALRSVRGMKGLGQAWSQWRFRQGKLVVSFEELQFSIPATGLWNGVAKVPKKFLNRLAGVALDHVEAIPITVEGGRLHVAGFSYDCRWTKGD
jgi:hypothetical protein